MKVVVKLGGVNGSGKTTVARAIMNAAETKPFPYPLPETGKTTHVHKGIWNGMSVWVLGKYENACGGMDTISNKDDRYGLVEKIAKLRGGASPDIVFFEGLITGKTYGALGDLSERNYKNRTARWLYTFMDTPFDVAVERVLARRQAAGNDKPFDPERTLRPTYDSCVRLEGYLRKTIEPKSSRLSIGVDHEVLSLKHNSRPATLAKRVLEKAEEVYYEGF